MRRRGFARVPVLVLALLCASSAQAFELNSPSLPPGATFSPAAVFHGFGCSGANLSPALAWRDVPPGTRSFALSLFDRDAPTGSGWWHWVVVDLPPSTRALPSGVGRIGRPALPAPAIQIRNDFGSRAYGGPCPPLGDPPHRYVFTLYALKTARLPLPSGASAAMAGFFIHANAIGATQLVVRYGRSR